MDTINTKRIEEFFLSQEGVLGASVTSEHGQIKVQVTVPQLSTLSENLLSQRCQEKIGVAPDRVLVMTARPNRTFLKSA
ncbi:MAG TPA: hypothetical protein VK171_02575 [Fimbriimonas sp.]|nr:hypothetical protein [Fimbriimonas sp.]